MKIIKIYQKWVNFIQNEMYEILGPDNKYEGSTSTYEMQKTKKNI